MLEKRTNNEIIRMEDLLNTSAKRDESLKVPKISNSTLKAKKPSTTIIKGQPKSGRFWKCEKTKFSSIIKSKGLKSSFARKQALREHLKQIKLLSRERKAKKQEQEDLRKERRRENLKRQEENRKKSEIVQVITNTKKLKKMKKKQLRCVEKRDTTVVVNK